MSNKNKIVVFEHGIAKILITDDIAPWLSKEDNETVFINPDMSYAKGTPPELWEAIDGKLVAMTDKDQIARRLNILHTDSEITIRSNEKFVDSLLIADAENKDAINALNINMLVSISKLEARLLDDNKLLDNKLNDSIMELKIDYQNKIEQLNKRWIIITIISAVLYGIKEFLL